MVRTRHFDLVAIFIVLCANGESEIVNTFAYESADSHCIVIYFSFVHVIILALHKYARHLIRTIRSHKFSIVFVIDKQSLLGAVLK